MWSSEISGNLAHGDSKEGVSIRSENDEIFLTYGANTSESNAQNMAVGYYNGSEYFFIVKNTVSRKSIY